MANFWWGHMKKDMKILWMKWSKMDMSKKEGKLGYRDIESFDQAMLAKQGLRILTNSFSLATKVFREKYFKHGIFFEGQVGY